MKRRYRFDPVAARYATRKAGFNSASSAARAAGLKPQNLSRLFCGARGCSASTLFQLADALGVDPRDLMIETEG